MTAEPEYLPMPVGYPQRAAALEGLGHDSAAAHWMAACEASGAIARSEVNHRDLFWFDEATDEERQSWDRIADAEGARYYFHQRLDTLVGRLAHERHSARQTASNAVKRGERLADFIREQGLWEAWVAHNRPAPEQPTDPA